MDNIGTSFNINITFNVDEQKVFIRKYLTER